MKTIRLQVIKGFGKRRRHRNENHFINSKNHMCFYTANMVYVVYNF